MIRAEYNHGVGPNCEQIRFEDARGSFPFDGSMFWSLESSLAQTVHRNSQKEVSGCCKEPEYERVSVCVCPPPNSECAWTHNRERVGIG